MPPGRGRRFFKSDGKCEEGGGERGAQRGARLDVRGAFAPILVSFCYSGQQQLSLCHYSEADNGQSLGFKAEPSSPSSASSSMSRSGGGWPLVADPSAILTPTVESATAAPSTTAATRLTSTHASFVTSRSSGSSDFDADDRASYATTDSRLSSTYTIGRPRVTQHLSESDDYDDDKYDLDSIATIINNQIDSS